MRFYLLALTCLSSFGFSAMPEGSGLSYTPPPQINVEENPKISVTFEGQTKPSECTLDSVKKMYFCPDSNTLITTNYTGFVALIKDKDNTAKLVSPLSVKAGDKILHTATPVTGQFLGADVSAPMTPSDLSQKLLWEQMAINEFFQNPGNSKEIKNGSEGFEKIAADFYKSREEINKTFNSVFQEKNYQVELSNGKNINCTRGTVRQLNEQQKNYENQSGQKYNCYAFKCDDVTIDGKNYQASMIFNSSFGNYSVASIHLRGSDGRGPAASVKKIKSPNSSMPLKDYSKFMDAPNLFNANTMMSIPGYQMLPNALPKDIAQDSELAIFKDPNFMNVLGEAEYSCADNLGTIEKIKLSQYEALEKMANTEFVQLISIINGGTLLGQYIDPNQAAQLGCYYGGLYLNEAAAKNLDKIKKNIYPDEQVDQTIDLDRANQLFKKARAMNDIAWDYKPDGCYARAHLMARRFEAEGVRVDKVWIKGNLYVPETNISWNFHVAPIVYVKDKNGKIQKMVIDPSLFDKPVTVEEWDNKMTKQTQKGSSITAFPFPQNAALTERSALAFSSSDPYLPGDNIDMSEEDKLQLANDTMYRYKNIGEEQSGIYNYPGMQAP